MIALKALNRKFLTVEREFAKRSIKLNRLIWYVELLGSIFK